MVTFTIDIPQMLVYIAYMDPMGIATECIIQPVIITFLMPNATKVPSTVE